MSKNISRHPPTEEILHAATQRVYSDWWWLTPTKHQISKTLTALLVVGALHAAQIVKCASVAAGTLVALDHVITLDQEVELIWHSPNGYGKWLFITSRYYGLISAIFNNYALFTPSATESFCRHWFQWQGWSGMVFYIIAELILQLRLFALYHLNKTVLTVIVASFLIAITTSGTLLGVLLDEVSDQTVVLLGVPTCMPAQIPKYFYAFWIPILAFESLLCGLAVFRGFRNIRLRPSVYHSGKEIVDVLLRDSVVYYVILLSAYVVNMVLFLVEPENLLEVPIVFAPAMACIMGNRLLLNIRKSARHREDVLVPSPHTAYGSGISASGRAEAVEMGDMGFFHPSAEKTCGDP